MAYVKKTKTSNDNIVVSMPYEQRNEHQRKTLDGVAAWASYYRSNPHRFAKDFLHIELHIFQKILLMMMNHSNLFVFIACRGIGKSFISAVYCCIRCILYPGTKVCIASGTVGQSLNVLEKIMTELKPNSPELAYEIDDRETRLTGTNPKISFKNGSYIKVVTATDNARGNRAHILILDEFRMIKKDAINTILKKFLSNPRHPKFLDKPEYKHDKSLYEPLKTLYLSSAYYKDHWSYIKAKDACRFMLSEHRTDFVCGFPYQLAIKEGLLSEERVVEDMTESDFSEIKWSIKYISVDVKPIEHMQKWCNIGYFIYSISRKWLSAVLLTGKLLTLFSERQSCAFK